MLIFIFCLFCSVSDGKSCFIVRKSISTSKRCAEHPFAGQNTQHPLIQSCVIQITTVYKYLEDPNTEHTGKKSCD